MLHKIESLTLNDAASICDHTFLKRSESYKGKVSESGKSAVRMREEAYEAFMNDVIFGDFTPYAVCVRPEDVKRTKNLIEGDHRDIKIASVVGFPDGSLYTLAFKIAETRLAIEYGADEIDMVLNYKALISGDLDYVRNDIGLVVNQAHKENALVKVILENCELSPEQIVQACKISDELEVDFVKTSTGFGKYGANVEDLKLMRKNFPRGIKISGGVRESNYRELLGAASGRDDGHIDLDPMKIRIGESGLLK